MLPAIIIVAYNRSACLRRLLEAVANANYPGGEEISLIISIDKSDVTEVIRVANDFDWKHGKKKILVHEEHLGLREHVLNCGSLSQLYDSIIMLEDDLTVAPAFYDYAMQALAFYENENEVAGISLYNYEVAESCFYPFTPLHDDADVYFMQVASSWGQAWTAEQWLAFREWLKEHPEITDDDPLPDYIRAWSVSSWKKHYINYLIQNHKYIVFPKTSFSTNFGEPGTNADLKGLFQVNLNVGRGIEEYRLKKLSSSLAVYDSSFEIMPSSVKQLCKDLEGYDFEVDLYGTKNLSKVNSSYLLTTRKVSSPVKTYGLEMLPNILNVAYNIPGDNISLAKTKDVFDIKPYNYQYYYRESSIAEYLYRPYVMEMAHFITDKREFNPKYPKITLITISHDAGLLLPMLEPFLKQDYPNREWLIINTGDKNFPPRLVAESTKHHIKLIKLFEKSENDALAEVYGLSEGKIFLLLPPGNLLQENALTIAEMVFRRMPEVGCFTTVQTKLRTWENEYINSFPLFFRKTIMDKTTGEIRAKLHTLRLHLIAPDKPFSPRKSLKGWEWLISKLFVDFYDRNITYLRSVYRMAFRLPPVIRYEPETDSYYFSDY